jgi:T-complex protein 1 subunit gamma
MQQPGMNVPVLVMNTNTKRETGRKAQLSNISAAKAVADIVRTTLGPRAMLKMILDPTGGIVLTNDGNAILREVDVSHPAAKSVIELSRTQDEEVGDGTTSVIILAAEMLSVAEIFIERNLHPTIVVGAYRKALDEAVKALESISFKIDVSNFDELLKVAKSTTGTKFISRFGDSLCALAVKAVQKVSVDRGDGSKDVDIKQFVRIEKIPGGELEDSEVLEGIMLNKDVTHPQMKRRIENPRVLLLDCPLEYKKGESQTNIELTSGEDWNTLLKMEEEYIEKLCKDIIAVKPDLVITEKGVSDLAQHYLMKAGISAIRRVRKTDNNRIGRAVGAKICNRTEMISEEDIGTGCGLFEVKKIGDEYFAYLVQCKDPKACTVVLRGGSKDVLNEIERNLDDAMGSCRTLINDPRVVPGGGASEMAVSKILTERARFIEGVEQWPFRAVALALEVIPRTLMENCGAQTIRLLTELRAKHAESGHSNWGVDGNSGELKDIRSINIVEPLAVKSQTFKTAIESATLLLRVDEIVSGLGKRPNQ